jgi:protein-tyrosine kinase
MNTVAAPPREKPLDSQLGYELSPDLVTLNDSRAAEAEAIRTIRTHIVARHIEDGRRGVAVCAPTSKVGCTFTAVNLAVSLAQAGISTLLIDGDLRTPQVESFVRPLSVTPGLKDCIESSEWILNDCIHTDVVPNLSILYSGGRADNAQELLAGDRFKDVIERSLRDYEFTVIDTSPADVGADDLRIARIVGYAMLVAKAHVTRVSEISALASTLEEDGARVIGTVLNEL